MRYFLRGLIPWFGFNTDYVEFERDNRKKGNTGWSFSKMIDFSLTAFVFFKLSNEIIFLFKFNFNNFIYCFIILCSLLLSIYKCCMG